MLASEKERDQELEECAHMRREHTLSEKREAKDKEDETKQKKRLRKLQAVREAEAFKLQKFMDSVGSGAMDGDTDTWT